MITFNATLAALLPAVVLLWLIYRKDPVKEPVPQLLKGFGYGLVAAGLAIVMESTLVGVGLVSKEPHSILSAVNMAFVGAAIPEELAKLFMLWLLLRRNHYFDEYFDGVVYAASIGLGFAAIENVAYLLGNLDDWEGMAVMRGLFSVPGHFAFAVLMGYFYSLVHLGGRHSRRDRVMVLAAPVLAHGAYDTVLFMGSVSEAIAGAMTIVFLLLCAHLVKLCRRQIRTLRIFDQAS
ncbi:MAG: PrsW family intramembrane metalloprotease [Muribaculaceae bacterium]|nr:PrsW family intramembrane metalloprotease [Muribaculaceae bacterium]